MSILTPDERERFDGRWTAVRDGACHTWTGKVDKDGYGMFFLRRRTRRAHRVAWLIHFGPIPAGLVVNHSCRNRACVNPQHLRLFTPRENSLQDSNSLSYVNSRKTQCPRGHAYDLVVAGSRPYRGCSICEREKKRRLRAKWQAEGDQLGA